MIGVCVYLPRLPGRRRRPRRRSTRQRGGQAGACLHRSSLESRSVSGAFDEDGPFAHLLEQENDPFRLAIRGQVFVEQEVLAAIRVAFHGQDVPKEISGASYPARVALVVGLGILPVEMKGLYTSLATLRHHFAHGKIETLTPARAKSLLREVDATVKLGPDPGRYLAITAEVSRLPPVYALKLALLTAHSQLRGRHRVWEDVRTRAEQALREYESSPLLAALRAHILQPPDAVTSSDIGTERATGGSV